jgi:hypothetical protein
MIPKSVQRFSDQIMCETKSMIPKNVQRFPARPTRCIDAEIMRAKKKA